MQREAEVAGMGGNVCTVRDEPADDIGLPGLIDHACLVQGRESVGIRAVHVCARIQQQPRYVHLAQKGGLAENGGIRDIPLL